MTRIRTLLCVALALAFALPLAAQEAPLKIAVVDLDAVALEAPAGKKLQADLGQFKQDVEAQMDAMSSNARDIQRRAAEGANSLSADRLAELQQEFEDATIRMRRYQDDKNREAQTMQNEGLQKIEAELEPVFKAISDEMGLDLVLNQTPGVVIMAGPRVNITDQVIARLRAASQATSDSP